MYTDPIAFFLTWPTYGTWMPGDERGWIEYHNGWQLPDATRLHVSTERMAEPPCRLNEHARQIVEKQVAATCRHRKWVCHSVACRSNHMHIAVGAFDTDPKKIRIDVKAWCTRQLKHHIDSKRENWWAERGSVRYIWNDNDLSRVVEYIEEAQDRKDRDYM